MKLLIDVGNSRASFALSDGKILFDRGDVSTHPLTSLGTRIKSRLRVQIEEVWIGSVVRGATPVIEQTFGKEKLHRILPGNVGTLKNLTTEPEKVGVDRLINAVSALSKFKPPLIVIDSGTAITLCAINEKGEYLGGSILPGVAMMRDSLHEKTSLLPSIELQETKSAIGRNTEQALLSGILIGAAKAIEGIANQFEKEIQKGSLQWITTGGSMGYLLPWIDRPVHFEPDLTLQGIMILSEQEKTTEALENEST